MEYLNDIKTGFVSRGMDVLSAQNMGLASLQKKVIADLMLRGVDEIFMMLCIISIVLMVACLCLKVFNIHYEVWRNTYPLTKLS